MCGPMRGAIVGAILYEGWTDNPRAAENLAADGGIKFSPCHEYCAVGPMCGVISPSMPLFVVANKEHGNAAYAPIMESGGAKTLRFGAFAPEVIAGLKWIEQVLAPTLKVAVTGAAKSCRLSRLLPKPCTWVTMSIIETPRPRCCYCVRSRFRCSMRLWLRRSSWTS